MDREIRKVLRSYNHIFENRKMVMNESQILGIDELVFNPVTKKGGTIGFGYDGGNRVEGIEWSGHDDHLHISFTDKKTAMSVIDKAHSMGLKTTENPYAKSDYNRKVDPVHKKNSFHYKNFPGLPLVGMAVDISGDVSKITTLIQWIESEYAGRNIDVESPDSSTESKSTKTSTEEDPILFNTALKLGKELKLQEGFGKNTQNQQGSIIIPGSSNSKIVSPVDGYIDNRRYVHGCKNNVTIVIDGYPNMLQYCGITRPLVKNGDKVRKGDIIGTMDSNDNVEVLLLDKSFKRDHIEPYNFEKKFKKKDTKKEEKRYKESERTYYDPAIAALMLAPFELFKNKYDKDTGEIKTKKWTTKGDADPWILDLIKKPFKKLSESEQERKIVENIQKIKKML